MIKMVKPFAKHGDSEVEIRNEGSVGGEILCVVVCVW